MPFSHVATLALCALATTTIACSDNDMLLRIERQPTQLANTRDDAWVTGSAIVVGEPGAFTFPQAVSVRMSLVDSVVSVDADGDAMVEPRLVSSAKATIFGEGGVGEITENVACQPTYCEVEITMSSSGLAVLQLTAQNTEGEEADCFYYGVYENADPVGAGEALRTDAESSQQQCQRDLFD